MLQTFKGILDQDGKLRTTERINLSKPRQVMVTLLDTIRLMTPLIWLC